MQTKLSGLSELSTNHLLRQSWCTAAISPYIKILSIFNLKHKQKLFYFKCIILKDQKTYQQCLGSGSWSVGSARFWLPGSGSRKICGSTNLDLRGKISTKNWKKIILLSKPKSELLKKEILEKFPDFWMVHQVLA